MWPLAPVWRGIQTKRWLLFSKICALIREVQDIRGVKRRYLIQRL